MAGVPRLLPGCEMTARSTRDTTRTSPKSAPLSVFTRYRYSTLVTCFTFFLVSFIGHYLTTKCAVCKLEILFKKGRK